MKYLLMASLICIIGQACSKPDIGSMRTKQLEMRLQKIEFDISCIKSSAVFSTPYATDEGAAMGFARGAVLSAQQGNEYARNWIKSNITNQRVADVIYYSYAISPLSTEGEIKQAFEQVDSMIERAANNKHSAWLDSYEVIAAIFARNGVYDKACEYQLKSLASRSISPMGRDDTLKIYENKQPFVSNVW